MRGSRRGMVRFVPEGMRSGRGRNVSVVLAAFATVAAAVTFVWARGHRRTAIAN
ncbi:MAG TPA: hypothetical protein VFR33_08235 [Candidatus Dormibacteraeota bacterium]|nr:hypothetical protein [Candidatus Dormibacteraeota bacterium]